MASSAQVATTPKIQRETQTGSHLLKIFGYSLMKGIGVGKDISSDVFTVQYVVTSCFYNTTGRKLLSQGYHIVKRDEFEVSECLKDDAFTVYCTVTVLKYRELDCIAVPPSSLNQNLASMLESGKGADVRFLVKGEEFHAHRCVLAARSVVFSAMLFDYIKEEGTDTIIVDDINAPVFKSMLHFIYTDSLPSLDWKQDLRLMAEHLLVAADKYALEMLRLMCEDMLSKHLSVSNAATTIIMAERYNCNQLKAQCLKFMSLPEVFIEVALKI